jgi:hypothetical protein
LTNSGTDSGKALTPPRAATDNTKYGNRQASWTTFASPDLGSLVEQPLTAAGVLATIGMAPLADNDPTPS